MPHDSIQYKLLKSLQAAIKDNDMSNVRSIGQQIKNRRREVW